MRGSENNIPTVFQRERAMNTDKERAGDIVEIKTRERGDRGRKNRKWVKNGGQKNDGLNFVDERKKNQDWGDSYFHCPRTPIEGKKKKWGTSQKAIPRCP